MPYRPSAVYLSPQPRAITAVLLSFPSHSYCQFLSYRILSRTQTMDVPQPSNRPLELPPNCNSCQYCESCDPKNGDPRRILRFCQHGLGRTFVELRDSVSSGHDCPATAPLRRATRTGQQPGNPRTTQSGQIPIPQPQQPSAEAIRAGFIYRNNLATDNTRIHYGQKYAEVPLVEGPTVYEGMIAEKDSEVHAGNVYNHGNTTI